MRGKIMAGINITTVTKHLPYEYGKETTKDSIINVKDVVCHWPFSNHTDYHQRPKCNDAL
jgi:predicted hydrocarbon binding protein